MRVGPTAPLSATVVAVAALLLVSCASNPTLYKPTCCDHAVMVPPSVEVSGVLLITGGAGHGPIAVAVVDGIVTFQSETGLGLTRVVVRTGKGGAFQAHLVPGVYKVRAASSTSPASAEASFAKVRIDFGGNKFLRLTLVAI